MGKVTEELLALITKQIQDHGIVVWYDPEHAYGDVIDQMHTPEITVLRYESSVFQLRHHLEPFLEFVDDAGRFHANIEPPPTRAALGATRSFETAACHDRGGGGGYSNGAGR